MDFRQFEQAFRQYAARLGSPLHIEEWTNPAAADSDAIVDAAATAETAQVLALDGVIGAAAISPPRNLVVTVNADADWLETTLTIPGFDIYGAAISEDFEIPTGGDATLVGSKAYALVSPPTLAEQDGTAGEISIGTGDKIGLSRPIADRVGSPLVVAEYHRTVGQVTETDQLLGALGAAGVLPHYSSVQTQITEADSEDLATSKTLTKALADAFAAHQADTAQHSAAGAIAAPAAWASSPDEPADLDEVEAVLNELKADFNAHLILTDIHRGYGGQGGHAAVIVSTTDATDQGSADTLANALKVAMNRHQAAGAMALGTVTTQAVGAPNGTYTPSKLSDAAEDYVLVYEQDYEQYLSNIGR
jgi:hypothetical protein